MTHALVQIWRRKVNANAEAATASNRVQRQARGTAGEAHVDANAQLGRQGLLAFLESNKEKEHVLGLKDLPGTK
jgi:hypothetical protein